MDFDALRLETQNLLKFGGWFDVGSPVDLAGLVNEALRLWSWQAEYKTGQATFTTAAGTAEYTLSNPPDWKIVKDVYYGTTARLARTSEDLVRMEDPLYRVVPNGTPDRFWMPLPNVVRLYPTPATSGTTVTVYGIRADADLANPTDTPGCPAHYHRAVARLAAFLHAERYAQGEEKERIRVWYEEAMAQALDCQLWMASQNQVALQRRVRQRSPGRLNLTSGGDDGCVRSV
jgi:hypothetical protein